MVINNYDSIVMYFTKEFSSVMGVCKQVNLPPLCKV